MKQAYIIVLFIVNLLCFQWQVSAQTYYPLSLTNPQNIGGNTVYRTAWGAASGYVWCGTSPFKIGDKITTFTPVDSQGSFTFAFKIPVTRIRINMIALHDSEMIRFYMNGTRYLITNSNVSTYASACSTSLFAYNYFGDLAMMGGVPYDPTTSGSGATVDIMYLGGIDTFRVHHITGKGHGSVFDMAFAYDTIAFLRKPFADTLLCAGRTVKIKYGVTYKFKPNNTFSIQLSDAAGSFSSPVTIGSIASDTADTIACVIPANLTPGNGYKMRVVSTNPAYVSNTNYGNIIISNLSVTQPVASSNSPLCVGDTIRLFATGSGSGATYKWSGPNLFSSTQQNPFVANPQTYASGDYIVTAVIGGCDAKDTVTVAVNPYPAVFTVSSNTPVCSGNALNLSASTTSSGTIFYWTGPNSYTSSSQNPSIANAQTGASGKYLCTIALNNCQLKDSMNVLVKPSPANVNATSNSPICTGNSLSLGGSSSTSGVAYGWTGPNSFTSSSQNPSISNAQLTHAGDYILTCTLNGCPVSDTVAMSIGQTPAKPSAAYISPICEGDNLLLNASTVSGAGYNWVGPGYTSFSQNPILTNITLANAGYYYVRTALANCYSAFDSLLVAISQGPQVNVYPNPNDTICMGANVTYIAIASGGGATPQYQWLKNNVPVAGMNSTAYPTSSTANGDVIMCRLINNTTCSSVRSDTSNPITMTVLPWLAPSVSITANPSTPLVPNQLVTFTAIVNNAGTKPGYQWQRNGSDVVGATSFTWGTYQLSDKDDISVVVASSYMCPQPPTVTSNAVKVTVLTSVDDINNENKIALYPNPNNGSFTLTGNFAGNANVKLAIVNAVGQLVYQKNVLLKNGAMNEQLNVQGLARGIYVLRIEANNHIQNIRFNIESN